MAVRSRMRVAVFVLGFFLLALLIFRLYLPTLVKNYANRVLDRIPGYHGHIEDVHIHLWRSAYSIIGPELLKTGGEVPVPFFSADKLDFSIHWNALFHGQLVGKLEMDQPRLNFVAADSDDQKQMSIDQSWQKQFKALFPLRISRLRIIDGEIHFRNYQAAPVINVFIHDVNALATNLTNSRKVSKTLKATLDAQGIAMTDGKLKIHLEIDPLAEKPAFEYTAALEDLSLPELNSYFSHYLAVNMKSGTFSFYGEGASQNGLFKGYVKPILDHVDFVRIKENPSVGEFAKGLVVKVVSYTMKNHSKNRLATRIEINGTVDNPELNPWTAVSSFLRNWIVRAIMPGLEGSVRAKDVKS